MALEAQPRAFQVWGIAIYYLLLTFNLSSQTLKSQFLVQNRGRYWMKAIKHTRYFSIIACQCNKVTRCSNRAAFIYLC